MNDSEYEAVRALANLLADSPEPLIVMALDATIVRWNAAGADHVLPTLEHPLPGVLDSPGEGVIA